MNMKIVIALVIAIFLVNPVNTGGIFSRAEKPYEIPEKEEYHHQGSVTIITSNTAWLSNDPEEVKWVVEVPGVPEEVYVIDRPAQEEISHTEIVHHPARTHKENVYSTRTKYTVYYGDGFGTVNSRDFYDYSAALAFFGSNDGISIEESEERYVSDTRTVIDRPAYDETVTIIDQPALEEIGHYETVIVGEVGHYENLVEMTVGEGDGHFETTVRMNTAEYHNLQEE